MKVRKLNVKPLPEKNENENKTSILTLHPLIAIITLSLSLKKGSCKFVSKEVKVSSIFSLAHMCFYL
jgi:hypothetical protein